jgi:flavodoxin
MRALVVFDTTYSNTARIARAIGEALSAAGAGSVEVRPVALVSAADLVALDLLVVGGPTQRHGMSRTLSGWLGELGHGSLAGVVAAAFDTRYRMPKLLTGSAAGGVARRLRRAGCRLVVPPQSFFVSRDRPPPGEKRRHATEAPEPGEEERASAWARTLADARAD